MRVATALHITPRSAPESQKPRFPEARLKRGTEESNLALRFWRPAVMGIWASKYGLLWLLGIVVGIENARRPLHSEVG
jgi:hypothetical protein